jgi:hypothetical protein
MRVVLLVISFLAIAPVVNGQTTTNEPPTPGVEVIKFGWSKERLNWQQNPFGGPNENFHEMQFRARSEKRLSDAKRGGNTAEIKKLENDAKADAKIAQARRESENADLPRYVFLYRSSIKNGSTKAIKELDWDYVFFDAMTGEELGRREFSSMQTIGPGKSKELSFMIPTPPTRRISVNALDRKERVGIQEQVVIVRIKYEDGSVWQKP